jgi:uncharacterized RDD family membrane protein YckC
MVCNHCDQFMLDDDRFCKHCGAQASSVVNDSSGSGLRPSIPEIKDINIDSNYKYAGFWWRLIAYFIDSFILWIGYWMLALIFGLNSLFYGSGSINYKLLSAFSSFYLFIFMLLALLGPWLYFSLMESSSLQGTIGKWALKLRVVDEQGNALSFGRATGRFFGKLLSSLTFSIGYIMIAFTERKQGLHDIIARTIVLRRR